MVNQLEQCSEIAKRCHEKGFSPEHVSEVGVWYPDTSNIIDFIDSCTKVTLVEANPSCIAAIRKAFGERSHVFLHPVAVYDRECSLEMYHRGASTFIGELPATPTKVNDGYEGNQADSFTVDAVKFSSIDDGGIDLLSIDIEGAEWYVLKHMTSRPKVLSVETHGKYYINPFMSEITVWMKENGYVVWYKDASDTVYVDPKVIEVTILDRLRLCYRELSLAWRRLGIRKVFSLLKKPAS